MDDGLLNAETSLKLVEETIVEKHTLRIEKIQIVLHFTKTEDKG